MSILNLQNDSYWYGEKHTYPNLAWAFYTSYGAQGSWDLEHSFHSWAVRAGDVSQVPVPGAVWLFSAALLGLVGVKRRRR